MNNMKIHGIYKIRNCINGKVYIGQFLDIYKRFNEHKRNARKNKNHLLYHSMYKHDIDNFEFIIIELVTDYMKLDEREQYWLDFYKSYTPGFGYNLRLKAESNRGIKRSKETKEKLSLLHKGKPKSEEHKLKIGLANKGRIPNRKGYKHSEETKAKIVEAQKIRRLKEKNNNLISCKEAI